MNARISHRWTPIQDLPADWKPLESGELRALSQVWEEQRPDLEDKEALQTFNERLRREWAIETGILERLYTLDRGITRILIEKGLDASLIPHGSTEQDPHQVVDMIRDHRDVVEGLFQFVKGGRSLSTSYIKELHAALTRHQDTAEAVDTRGTALKVRLLRGEYEKLPNNPSRPDGSIHEYCPPEQVASEMDRLIELQLDHEKASVPPEVEAAWLHHRFTQIHPFQDGNGRVARCLASLVLIKSGWFPLTVTRDDRDRYTGSLEEADQGDLLDHVRLFASIEKRAFVSALAIDREVRGRKQVSQVIQALRERLEKDKEDLKRKWELAKLSSRKLQRLGLERLKEIEAELKQEIGKVEPKYRFFVDDELPGGKRAHYFRHQVTETARRLGYYANFREHRAWTRLVLEAESRGEILLSYHAVGQDYRGILAVTGTFFWRSATEEHEAEVTDVTPLSDEIFQVNYAEPSEQVEKRFRSWLESVLTKGLDLWRRGL